MSTGIRAAVRRWRLFLVPALAMSGCLLVEPPSALKSHPADGNGGAAGSGATNTSGSGASGKAGASAGSGGRIGGASGNMPTGDGAGAAGESPAVAGGGATTAGAGGSSAGQNSGGTHAGGTTAGGSTGGAGAPTGGSAGAGAGAGGTGGAGATGGGGGTGGSAPAPSHGCTVTNGQMTLTTGGMSMPVTSGLPTSTALTITSGGMSREYVIDIPADYNPKHPYRLIFSWHQAYGSDVSNASGVYPANNGPNFNATNYAFFGLRREANAANDPAIFVAPLGIGNLPWDFTRDSALFDDLLTFIDANLCIDDSRVFSAGFSFGAMMSYALSITRQTKLRAVVAMAAANYSLPGEPTDTNAAHIAYMGTTGMSDSTCPWVSSDMKKEGGKYCVLAHAQDNGCTIPQNIPTTTAGSKTYVCYDFTGCTAGYPVKVCTFDGAHTPASVDDGTSTGDDGLLAFIPPLAWKFIAQF